MIRLLTWSCRGNYPNALINPLQPSGLWLPLKTMLFLREYSIEAGFDGLMCMGHKI